MTFQDPGARVPVDIQVRLRGGNAPFDAESLPDYEPPKAATPQAAPFDPESLPDYQPAPPAPPEKPIGTAQAFAGQFANQLEIGTGPMFEGLAAAAGPEWNKSQAGHDIAPLIGGVKMLGNYLSSHPDPEIQKSFREGRDAAQADLDLGSKQHRIASTLGSLAGAVALPVKGLGAAGLGARLLRGAAVGGVLGGAQSGGEALSRGESAADIGGDVVTGGLIGGATGGLLHGTFGPRLPRAAVTPAEKAAVTAADLGAPLPRGLVSNVPYVDSLTARLQSVPLVGSRITENVRKTAEAAGERIGDISGQMASGAPDRSAADVLLRPALQDVIEKNRQKADALYNNVRSSINPDKPYQLPRTQAVLDRIVAARQAAGWANPEQGLEQFQNVAQRGSFNGAHRARVDARNAGSVLNPNPGYNKGDFNAITGAMSEDLRSLVRAEGGQKALDAFEQAETEFGKMAKQNAALNRLVNARGEGAIATLLGAAKEKGGDVGLLAGLKASMDKPDFEQVGGTLLHEIGQNPATGEFSLAKFVTDWGKVSDGAKRTLFEPQHLKDINDIVAMGQHIKGALRETGTSHTAHALIAFDAIKDVAELGFEVAAGGAGIGAALKLGGTAVGGALTYFLGSPAKAASLRAFGKSYQGYLDNPTPARAAVFKIATRNLAHNLSIPLETLTQRLSGAQPQTQSPQQTPAGPVNQ